MSDELFPSGPWTGFYTYTPQDKHRMDLHLTFAHGQISGAGNDDIGPFVISGSYDVTALECRWAKKYLGQHEVYYEGYREGKGIWGRWEINAFAHGGFHIWPEGTLQGSGESIEREGPVPVEAKLPAVLEPSPANRHCA